MNQITEADALKAGSVSTQAPGKLSAEFNWCDRLCERCPMAQECTLWQLEERRREAALERGQDPDSWEVVGPEIEAALRASITILKELARDEGLSPESFGVPSPPARLASARLRVRCRLYGDAVFAIADDLRVEMPDEVREALRVRALLVTSKGARIASYLDDRGELASEAGLMDGVPNLLLLDHLMRVTELRLAEIGPAPRAARGVYETERERLRRILSPLLQSVPPEVREELRSRIAERRAPSPFCVVPSATGRRSNHCSRQ